MQQVQSKESPGVTGKFGFGVQNEAGQRLTAFCQENVLVIANTLFQLRGKIAFNSLICVTRFLPDGVIH